MVEEESRESKEAGGREKEEGEKEEEIGVGLGSGKGKLLWCLLFVGIAPLN